MIADRSLPRIDYIDGLRAIAVLTVLVSHVGLYGNLGPAAYRTLLEGAHGVDLFFVLSGFCLAYPTLAKLRAGRKIRFDFADFGAKRIARIVPPFYLATALLLVVLVLPSAIRHGHVPPDTPRPWQILASLLFIDGNVPLVNSSFWTLMVEFRWYFVFPLVLWLWIASPRGFGVAALASAALYHLTRARGLDLGTLPCFMLGIVAADIEVGGTRTAGWGDRLRRWAPLLFVAGVLAGIAAEPWAWIPNANRVEVRFPYQPTILGWQVAAFAFVVAGGAHGVLRRILSLRALVAVGIASYGIYLVHQPAIELVAAHVHGPLGALLAGGGGLAGGCAFWAVCERPFAGGPVRARLVAALRPRLAGILAYVGVARALDLEPAAKLSTARAELPSEARPLTAPAIAEAAAKV